MSPVKWLAIPMLIVSCCCAQNPPSLEKPVCNARNRGKLWPEKAARHTAAVPIELCSVHFLHYRWQQLTVDVSHLREKAAALKAPEPGNAANRR
jgi:hypothetical protein